MCGNAWASSPGEVQDEKKILELTQPNVHDYAAARKVVDRLLKADPTSHVGLMYDGLLRIWKGNPAELVLGRQSLERDVQLHPKEASARLHLANAYIAEGRFTQALTQSDEAIRLMPALASPYLVKARAQMRLRQFAAALATNEVARRKAQPMPDNYNTTKFICLTALGRSQEAKAVLQEALKTKQFQDWVLLTAASEALMRQDNEVGAQLADALLKFKADDPAYLRTALDVNVRLNRLAEIEQYSKQLFRMRPHDVNSRVVLAGYYIFHKQAAHALRQLSEVLPADRNPDWYRLAFQAHKGTLQLDLALEDINYVVAHNQSDPRPVQSADLFTRAELYMMLAQPEKAIVDYTSAIKLAPHRRQLYDHRASAYEDLGNSKAAAADRKTAQSL